MPDQATPAATSPAVPPSSLGRTVVLYGVVGGALTALLEAVEYRYLVVEHSLEIYGGLVAATFAVLGIWLGGKLVRPRVVVEERVRDVVREIVTEVQVPAPAPVEPFVPDPARLERFGITPREHEILVCIAEGLSTREIAERLFVSENTVKTHASRLYAKLDARRRTQAVQRAKREGLVA